MSGTKSDTVAALGADAFNGKLARKFQGLKKALGATAVRQGYRGTGSKRHRRQIWVRMPGLPAGRTDLWLDEASCSLGGVSDLRRADAVEYGDLTVAEVYDAVVGALEAVTPQG